MSDTVKRPAGATHGKPFAAAFHEPDAAESQGNSVAIPLLNVAIDKSGMPRKQLADKIDKTEQTFSKMTTTGPNAQAFGLDAFERLPLPIQIAWLKRYGRSIGLEVREIDAVALADAIVERFDEIQQFVRMFQIGRKRQARVAVPSEAEERRLA